MKTVIHILLILILSCGIAFAAGGKNHGEKAQGSSGSEGQGQVTQHSR